MTVYRKNHTKHSRVHEVCSKRADHLFIIIAGSTYSYHWGLKGYICSYSNGSSSSSSSSSSSRSKEKRGVP
jgi:hypothetical protein